MFPSPKQFVISSATGLALALVDVIVNAAGFPGGAVAGKITSSYWIWAVWGYAVVRIIAPNARALSAGALGAVATGTAGLLTEPFTYVLGLFDGSGSPSFLALAIYTIMGTVTGLLSGLLAGMRLEPSPWPLTGAAGIIGLASFALYLEWKQRVTSPVPETTTAAGYLTVAILALAHVALCIWAGVTLRKESHRRRGATWS